MDHIDGPYYMDHIDGPYYMDHIKRTILYGPHYMVQLGFNISYAATIENILKIEDTSTSTYA